jgi:hypothetical protein
MNPDESILKPEFNYLSKMTSLQENILLSKVFLYNSPLYAIGILGCFYPWIYAFVPVHASEICLCSFY